MNKIILFISNSENRRLLAEMLSARYDVILPENDQSLAGDFDLCLLDGLALDRLWGKIKTRKQAAEPAFLPFLFVTARQDVNMLTRHLWQSLDEVITTPIEKMELQARLENLLERRRFSLDFHRALYETSLDAILLTAPDGCILAANPAACRLFERSEAEICQAGRNGLVDLTDPRLPAALEERARTGKFTGELTFLHKNGEKFPCEVASALFTDRTGQTRSNLIIRDISARKQAEARVFNLNRLYATTSQVNQAIVHSHDQETLYQEICRVAVEYGKYRLAWVGLIDETERTVKPVHFAGDERGYLQGLKIAFQDQELGRGPTGTAVREGHCVICQDIVNDPRMAPWREAALQHGYYSSAAVPIRQREKIIGAFMVYAGEPNTFAPEDENLLAEIGADLSYALTALENDAKRGQAETSLRQNEERLRFALEATNDGLWDVQMESGAVFMSPRGCEILGYRPAEMVEIAKAWNDLVCPADLPLTQARLAAYLEGRTPLFEVEQRLKTRSGDWKWILTRGKAVEWDASGKPVRMTGTHTDISERKQAELALRASEARFAAIFHASPLGVNLFRVADGRSADVNEAYLEISGYSREEVVGHTAAELGLFVDPQMRAGWMKKLAEQGQVLGQDAQMRRKSGEIREVLAALELIEINGEQMGVVILADITERRQAEKALAASEKRYAALLAASSDVVYRMNPDWSEMRFLDGRDFIPDTLSPSQTWLDKYIHPLDQPRVLQAIQAAIRAKGVFELEHRVRQVDGSLGWTFSRAIPQLDERGEITEWFGMASDITARKQAEAELRESEEKFFNAFHVSPAAITLTRIRDGKFLDVNEAFLRLFEYSREDVIGQTSTELQILTLGERGPLIAPQLASGGVKNAELLARSKTGKTVNLLFSSRPMQLNGEDCHITILIDITERKRAAEQLRQVSIRLAEAQETERLALSRELHDQVGQGLSALGINLNLIRGQLGKEPPASLSARFEAPLELVTEITDKIRNVMAELHPPVLSDYGLAAALRWYAERMKQQTGLEVLVEGELIEPRLSLAHSAALFRIAQEALTNVVKHAGVNRAKIVLQALPNEIRLEISDQGRGFNLASPTRDEKPHWGLTTMRERAKLLDGRLEIDSSPGGGTKIIVQIPR